MRNNKIISEEQAWLTEYQTLQNDINSSASNYWTIATIFIGIISALVVALTVGLLNTDLIQIFTKTSLESINLNTIQTLQAILVTVAFTIIFVIAILRLWLKRIIFLQQINFERMRDIERILGMWKSWRVHGIDHWNTKTEEFDGKIVDSIRLLNYKPKNWWNNWRTSRKYETSSRNLFDIILAILMFAWLFIVFTFILIVWAPVSSLASIILAVIIAILVITVFQFTKIK